MLAWFTEELWLIPNWAWFAIIVGVACLLMAVIIVACVKKGDKKDKPEAKPEPVLMPAESESEKSEEKPEKEAEPVKAQEEVPAEQPAEEKKAEEKKPAAKKTAAKKPDVPAEEKKPAAKTAAKKAEKPAAKTEETSDVKVYHISKRDDKKWEVRIDGGDKALKLFFTQKEAIDYTRKISGKKRILVHKEDGGVREV